MYKILYDFEEYNLNEIKEVISFINCVEKKQQLIQITVSNSKSYIEIGVGMEDKSLLFHSPESVMDDQKISYNEEELFDKDDIVQLTNFNGKYVRCFKYNLINFNEAVEALEYFLKTGKLSSLIKWYSY